MKSNTNKLFESFQNNLKEEDIIQPYQQFFKGAEELINSWKNQGDDIEIIEHKNIDAELSTFFNKPELYKLKINDEDYSLIEFVDGVFSNDDPIPITLLMRGFINESEVADYINKSYEDADNEIHESSLTESEESDEESKLIKYATELLDDEEAEQKIEDGDYIWYEGAKSLVDVAYQWVNNVCGGISYAIQRNNLITYLDSDAMIQYYETTIDTSDEDLSNDEILEYMQDLCMEAYNSHDDEFLNLFFDYELLGRDIDIENYVGFYDDGALEILM